MSATPCAVVLLPSTKSHNQRSRRTACALRAQRVTRATVAAVQLRVPRALPLHLVLASAHRVAQAGLQLQVVQLVCGVVLGPTQLAALAHAHHVQRVITLLLAAAHAQCGELALKASVKRSKDLPLPIAHANHALSARHIQMWMMAVPAAQ